MIETKVCLGCSNIPKPITEFNIKDSKTGKRQSRCRDCTRKQCDNHYKNNKKYYLDKASKRNKKIIIENRLKLIEYLKTHPCVDCGESDPIVLEFDHMKDKKYNVSDIIRKVSWNKVKEEINKCEVRCANCHRRKTAKQFGYYNMSL